MSLQFISVGANKIPDASDYNEELDLIAFGAGRTIALWTPGKEVHGTAKGHNKTITAVKFINKEYVISGSEDASIKLWKIKGFKLVVEQTITVSKSITSISVQGDRIITGCMDGTISIWKFDTSLELIDKISINPRFYPLCLSMYHVSNEKSLLAVGGSSNLIHILCLENDKLSLKCSLEGHESWIRALSFYQVSKDVLYLASGSQDRYIRLWNIHIGETYNQNINTDLLSTEDEMMTNKIYRVGNDILITFEALLMGHDDWIVAMEWHPTECCLISASSDSSVMCWIPDEHSGIWICSSRLGDVSIKGSSTATGSSGGFWSLIVARRGQMIATVSKTGSWRLWEWNNLTKSWESSVSISGHVKAATDCSWEDHGEYLLTTSLDQTTRLWSTKKDEVAPYYEMARPQIHGYDMVAVKSLNRRVFVSAGDEKTVRVFEEPRSVANLLARVCGGQGETSDEHLPSSATVPALGLSNKESSKDGKADIEDEAFEERVINGGFTLNPDHMTANELLDMLDGPPKEDHLQRYTLFPELEKLYGHGYEISCIDISHDKSLLATCCKANNETHAIIRLYDAKNWHQIEPPCEQSHSLTVTRMRFSPNDEYLLSVSRDRKWTLWRRDGLHLKKHFENAQGHSRIIWDCAWIDDKLFLTGSRDKSIALWNIESPDKPLNKLKFTSPVTCVDFKSIGSKLLAAVGLENGDLYLVESVDQVLKIVSQIDTYDTPDLRVNRIVWSPTEEIFAVASQDSSVRIYKVDE